MLVTAILSALGIGGATKGRELLGERCEHDENPGKWVNVGELSSYTRARHDLTWSRIQLQPRGATGSRAEIYVLATYEPVQRGVRC